MHTFLIILHLLDCGLDILKDVVGVAEVISSGFRTDGILFTSEIQNASTNLVLDRLTFNGERINRYRLKEHLTFALALFVFFNNYANFFLKIHKRVRYLPRQRSLLHCL
jgi:hypothetical protein